MTKREDKKKTTEYESIPEDRIDELIEQFCDGKAGRGDSPYTEEFHKEFTGQKSDKKGAKKRKRFG